MVRLESVEATGQTERERERAREEREEREKRKRERERVPEVILLQQVTLLDAHKGEQALQCSIVGGYLGLRDLAVLVEGRQ